MLPTYHQIPLPELADAVLDELLVLICTVFPDINQDDARWRMLHMPRGMAFCARGDRQLVGFKLGYATKMNYYYSWLGGVDPQWLRRGVARQLMQQQHEWLRSEGFTTVETGAQEANRAMCELNLASGFVVVGSLDKLRGRQLTFVKQLPSDC
jgi:GNAT superfamily N-acetyltransferase